MNDDRSPALEAALQSSEHPEWGDHDIPVLERIEPRFVAITWLWCTAATLALAAIGGLAFVLVTGRELTGTAGAEFGVLGIIFAFATFIAFVVTMVVRLVRVDHDRLANSMAVAALHVAVAVVLLLVELALLQFVGSGVTDAIEGGPLQQLGNVFVALERSAAVAVLACLLAVGMVPARGPRPAGTQHVARDQDSQL
jgi:hypothetical protein